MVLFELIKRCLDSGYELRINKELEMIRIHVIYKEDGYDIGSFRSGDLPMRHECEQLLDDNHLYEMNKAILYCIDKIDQLRAQHQKLLKQDNGNS